MNDPRRAEVERLAALTFKARQERIVREFGEERNRVINRVTLTHNAAGYLPALIAWAVDRLRQQISAQADAYIEAFNAFNVPCDTAAERTLESTAIQFAAGSIGNVRGDRSVKRHRLGQGSPWHLEIEREMRTSLREAIARMRHQSAIIRNRPKEPPMNQTFNVQGPNARVNIDSVDNSTNVVHQGVPFLELRKAIESGVSDGVERTAILQRLSELEGATDRESGSKKYQAFIAAAANHMALVGPYLPALGHWVHGLLGAAI
jgi:hypothetical protein